jgi:hypothetical protein
VEYKGYFTTLQDSARRAKERGYSTVDNLPPGLGTIYSWDFAYVDSFKYVGSNIDENDSNAVYFRYIGQAAQINTNKRINDHVVAALGKKGERKMYEALGTALKFPIKDGSKFPSSASITSGNEDIVRVVHVASLFDLAALESHMIENGNKGFGNLTSAKHESFSDMINTKPNYIGLNTLGSGVSALKAGSKTVLEAISAAFFYLTENDPMIIKARNNTKSKETLPDANLLLKNNNNDYKAATFELFKEYKDSDNKNIENKFQVISPGFNNILKNFYKKLGGKYNKGFDVDNKGMIDLNKKFGKGELSILFSFKDFDDKQILKSIFFTYALEADSITEKSVIDIYNRAKKTQEQKLGKGLVMKSLIDVLYGNEIKKLNLKRPVKVTISKPKGVLTSLIDESIKRVNKKLPSFNFVYKTKEAFLSKRAMDQESLAGDLDYISEKDLILIRELIVAYTISYIEILGVQPGPTDIGNILGLFAKGKKNDIISSLKKEGLSGEEAIKVANNFIIESKWTTS